MRYINTLPTRLTLLFVSVIGSIFFVFDLTSDFSEHLTSVAYVHYVITYDTVNEIAESQGIDEPCAHYLAETIALADDGVDNWGADLSVWSRMHWATLYEAEVMLDQAVAEGDLVTFGRSLHVLQDYYAHRYEGYTIPRGVGGAIVYLLDCYVYGETFDWHGLWTAYWDYGHFLTSILYGPEYDTEYPGGVRYLEREHLFIEGTRYWTTQFLESYAQRENIDLICEAAY